MPRIVPVLAVGFALIAGRDTTAAWRIGTEVSWHDNVTNGEGTADVLSALQWSMETETGIVRNLRDGLRVTVGTTIRVEAWPRFEGLDFASAVFAGGWEYKPGLGPYRPVFAADLEGEGRLAREPDRGGVGGAGSLSVRQRVGRAWRLLAGHEWRRFEAKGRAFDRTGREWSGRVEWNQSERWAMAAEVLERTGDVVSYTRPPRPDLEALGKPITYVDTFEQDVPWIAYYFKARTRSAALESVWKLGPHSLLLRYEQRQTLHTGPGYRNRVTTLRLSRNF